MLGRQRTRLCWEQGKGQEVLRAGVHQFSGLCSKLQGLQVELRLQVTPISEQPINRLLSNL